MVTNATILGSAWSAENKLRFLFFCTLIDEMYEIIFFTHLPIWLLNFTEGESFPAGHCCFSVRAFHHCSALQSNSQPLSGS